MAELERLKAYSGESLEQLLGYEGRYRIDSLVVAIDSAIQTRKGRGERLAPEETIVLAVEAMEREVNNGGYSQFFGNSSKQYVPHIVDALIRIGCPNCADVTRVAIAKLAIEEELTEEAIDEVMDEESDERDERLGECADAFYSLDEDLSARLFEFIKANRGKVRVG